MKRKLLFILSFAAVAVFVIFVIRLFVPAIPLSSRSATRPEPEREPWNATNPPPTGWNLWTNSDGAVYHREGTNHWWVGGEVPKSKVLGVQNAFSEEEAIAEAQARQAQALRQRAAYNDLNKQAIVFYGLAVDEKTNAVAGATVHAHLSRRSLTGASGQDLTLTTDSLGRFEVSNVDGETLSVVVTKRPDYYDSLAGLFHYSLLYGNKVHRPDPYNPAVFVLHKTKGPEPLVYFDRAFGVPNTGEPVAIDLTTGDISKTTGDLIVSINHPEPYSNLKQPAWSMKIIAVDGGFLRVENSRLEYMHEAPTADYQPVIEVVMEPGSPGYRRQFDGYYYVMTHNGRIFGKLRFHMNTYWDERGVPFGIKAYVNANGSRNLEVPLGNPSNVINVRDR